MFRIAIFALVLASTSSFAQTAAPSDVEVAKAWKICEPMEASPSIRKQMLAKGQAPWREGYENCEAVKSAYLKSKAGIDAKAAADAAAADKAAIDALAQRIK
jgi:hypothetical protein